MAERGIVQPQFRQRIPQLFVIVGVHRKQPGEHLRLHFPKPRQRLLGLPACKRQRIPHRRALDVADARHHEPDLPAAQLLAVLGVRGVPPHGIHASRLPGRHHPDLVAFLQSPGKHSHQRHHADMTVEPGVDDQRLQRPLRIPIRRRHVAHHALQHLRHVQPGLRADLHRIRRIQPDDVLDFLAGSHRVGLRQVHLVQHRQDHQVLLDRVVAVGHGLRLDPLRRVHHQQPALAGRKRP